MSAEAADRDNKRRMHVGVVTSDKMERTISVRVERLVMHPKYKKYVKHASVFKAHDENGDAKTGDRVEIQECRALSKTKRFRLVRVIAQAKVAAEAVEGIGS